MHEGEVAANEGTAAGESRNARQGLGQPGRKGKRTRIGQSGARSRVTATGSPRLEHPGGKNPGLEHAGKKRVVRIGKYGAAQGG